MCGGKGSTGIGLREWCKYQVNYFLETRKDAVVAQAVNSITWAFEGLLETLPDGVKPAHPLEAGYARPKFRWIPIKNEDSCCFRNHVANRPMW